MTTEATLTDDLIAALATLPLRCTHCNVQLPPDHMEMNIRTGELSCPACVTKHN